MSMTTEAQAFRTMIDFQYRELWNGRATVQEVYDLHQERHRAEGDAIALDSIAQILDGYDEYGDNSIMREIRVLCRAAGREA
jgi:hypothetical protein